MAWIVHLLQLLTISAGNLKLHFSPKIVGDHNAGPYEFPYQVSLQNAYTSFHFCGGVILNEKYVITSAHCVENIHTPSYIKVVVGTIDLEDPKVTNQVEKIIVHQKFSRFNSMINDIALLKMVYEFKRTCDTINFAHLPPRDFVLSANDSAIISGWGSIVGTFTNKLQRVNIFIADQDYCTNRYRRAGLNIYSTQICAYYPDIERGVCKGDSGGPLTVKGMVVGLISWTVGCRTSSYPAVYTRISSYIDWIEANAV